MDIGKTIRITERPQYPIPAMEPMVPFVAPPKWVSPDGEPVPEWLTPKKEPVKEPALV